MRFIGLRVVFVVLVACAATVSRSPFCIGAEMAQQTPSMPPEGNPGDQKPPDGAFCSRSKKPEHSCKCHAKCVDKEDGTIQRIEDPKCRAWCHPSHCQCPAECE